MKIVTLEDHFSTSMFREALPLNPIFAEFYPLRGKQVGVDIVAELQDLGRTRLAAMDAAGIDVQVVSLTAPGCEGLDAETAVPVAKDANDRLFDAVKAHPGRLAGFAALPTADPDASAKELERAVMRLGFKGAMINGHARGRYLDDKKYWSIFRVCRGAGRADLSAPDTASSECDEDLLRGLRRTKLGGVGFCP
jgi:predicted TIM-barrel fold metal-dependent hydrolase